MLEIERKFLVSEEWEPISNGVQMKQGYLSVDPERTVRIRIAGDAAFLTIKGKSEGISRLEHEYQIPVQDAESLLPLCIHTPVEKIRYKQLVDDLMWEVDVFQGANQGLVLAEIELERVDQQVNLPSWIKEEVSSDHRYFNAYLSQHPYSAW